MCSGIPQLLLLIYNLTVSNVLTFVGWKRLVFWGCMYGMVPYVVGDGYKLECGE